MISQKIYLIRHGQTDYNLQGIVQGSGVDASLNDRGRSQAEAFYNYYRSIPFERIYVSRLKRSKESVSNFISNGLPFEEHAALNEISWGNREGQRITPEEDAYYHSILRRWQQGETSIPIEGGESPDEVASRQKPMLDILRASVSSKPILICMHGRAMRILLCQMLNYPLGSMDMFEHENLGLYLLTRTESQFTVDVYNNTDHLAAMKAGKEVKA
ncbi:histidine phosphatase family protein [soil metagenome]